MILKAVLIVSVLIEFLSWAPPRGATTVVLQILWWFVHTDFWLQPLYGGWFCDVLCLSQILVDHLGAFPGNSLVCGFGLGKRAPSWEQEDIS